MALKKPVNAGGGPPAAANTAPSECAILFPTLLEYVTSEQWDDGTARVTSSLLLFCDGGMFKACLNDRDAGRSLWATGMTPEAVFGSLEATLASGNGDWRNNKQGAGRRR